MIMEPVLLQQTSKGKESIKRNQSMKGIIPKSTGITWRQNPPMASNIGGVWEC